jgi:putative endonuclease
MITAFDTLAASCRLPIFRRATPRAASRAVRRTRNRLGHAAEWVAAGFLTLKGYRVLARRYRARGGEIDLVAVRGGVVSFVEVKLRPTRADGYAALTASGARRLADAAASWIAARPRYQAHEQRLDAVLVTPWGWPLHVEGALG